MIPPKALLRFTDILLMGLGFFVKASSDENPTPPPAPRRSEQEHRVTGRGLSG